MKQLIAVAVTCALSSSVFADAKADAKKHMHAAAVAYKEGRFEDTLAALDKAYALDPRPELHYSIGQVYVKLGRCEDAIASYERFLASKPSQERVDIANQAIDKCRAQIADQQAAPPPEPVAVETTPPPVPPVPQPLVAKVEEPPTRPVWWQDKLGLGLTGAGAVTTVVGLVLYSSARGKIDDAESAPSYGDSEGLYDDARSQRTTALVITTVGLAATGVGVWRLLKKRREQRSGVAFVPTADGGVITYAGGF